MTQKTENRKPENFNSGSNAREDSTGTTILDAEVYEHSQEHPPRIITSEQLAAVTRGDPLYQAAAEVAIRRGYWIVVNPAGAEQ